MSNNIQRNSLCAGAGYLAGAYLVSQGYTQTGLTLMAGGLGSLGYLHFDRLSRTASVASEALLAHGLYKAFTSGCLAFFSQGLKPQKYHQDFIPAVKSIKAAINSGQGDKARLMKACALLEQCFSTYPRDVQLKLKTAFETLQQCKKTLQSESSGAASPRTSKMVYPSSPSIVGPVFDIPGAGFRCTLAQGDLIDVAKAFRTEAVMYGANETLTSGGATAGRVFSAAGPRLAQTTQQVLTDRSMTQVPMGTSVVTPCFELSMTKMKINGQETRQSSGIRHVIHTLGPRRNKFSTEKEANEALRKSIVGSLHAAMQAKVRSLTLIPLSSFNFGFDITVSIQITLDVLNEFRQKNPNAFDHVVLDIYDRRDFDRTTEQQVARCERALNQMATSTYIPFYDTAFPRTAAHDPEITNVFCNFWPCPIPLDGRVYPNAEAAMQADKTDDPAKKNHFTVTNGQEAWSLGRDIFMSQQRLSEWNSTRKFSRMLQAVRMKAKNPHFRRLLNATGGAYMDEHSPWIRGAARDGIWADGHTGFGEGGEINSSDVQKTTFADPDYPGQMVTLERVNALGQIIMKVRDEIRGKMHAPIQKRNAACKAFHAQRLAQVRGVQN